MFFCRPTKINQEIKMWCWYFSQHGNLFGVHGTLNMGLIYLVCLSFEWKILKDLGCEHISGSIYLWYHSNYPNKWFVLFQIWGRVIAFKDQIHKELEHTRSK